MVVGGNMLTHEDGFLKFQEVEVSERVKSESPRNFTIHNKQGELLGYVNYYLKWKKWVFTPNDDCIFDKKCLYGIIRFIDLHLDN